MTAIVLVSGSSDLSTLRTAITALAPDLPVFMHGEPEAERADIAACWCPAPGSLGQYSNLRLVQSIAAGIDNVLRDPSRPADVPLCRIVDADHRQGMTEYVIWAVLHFHRGLDQVMANQPHTRWEEPVQQPASACTVGVLGLGALGAHAAAALAGMGFSVRGWARSPKRLEGIATFAGAGQLNAFLEGLNLLVCLLPLTDETRGLLHADTFAQLAPGAALVNCGRGEHVVLPDLLAALDSGQLRGAVLDVFDHEPLPADDPLWRTPGIVITPHMASSASREGIARQVVANARRLQTGEALLNQADPQRGY
jgi:glyoxylate/hydroxypyruvate reductase A